MTVYLDSSYIISFADSKDQNHELALKIHNEALNERRITSLLAILELTSVYSRAGLQSPVALAYYSVEAVGAGLVEADLNRAAGMAVKKAQAVKLRTLDLLHLALSALAGADSFLTFDKEIKSREQQINEAFGLKVLP